MAETRPRHVRSVPTAVLGAILLLSVLTLYQILQTSHQLKNANAEISTGQAERAKLATSVNNSVDQTKALSKQVEALGATPVVKSVDIPQKVEVGPAGPKGDTGATGGIGPQGPPGPIGPQGPAGPQGKAGAYPQCLLAATKCIGPAGSKGEKGDTGAAGKDGAAGPAGADGANGKDGVDGKNGADGATGPAGPAGPQGPQGAEGPVGKDGPPGPQGPAGPSCPDGSTLQLRNVMTAENPTGEKAYICAVTGP